MVNYLWKCNVILLNLIIKIIIDNIQIFYVPEINSFPCPFFMKNVRYFNLYLCLPQEKWKKLSRC